MIATRDGSSIVLPGLATAHSHAFQRAMRGRTQRRATRAGSFWSWRGLMYALAERLDPETIHGVSKLAFAELAACGVTAVGEFHYVHHQPDGTPYDDRLVMAEAVVCAAREVGLRVTLLRTVYQRAGWNRPAESAQVRFSDADVEDALRDVEGLRARFAGDALVRVGIAPHSVRAVTRETLAACSAFAEQHGVPLHAHVSEQPREVQECLAEHGLRPVELLAELGALDARFCGVHATHLLRHEARLLGAARAFVCVCRTTERDLGDGYGDSAQLLEAGVRLCTGTDSHASSDPFEEARAIELDARSVAGARHAALDASELLACASANGYEAIGWSGAEREDRVVLDAHDPALVTSEDTNVDDQVAWSGSPRAVREVSVAGRVVVREGHALAWDDARAGFERAMRKLER